MVHFPSIPIKATINEYLEIAKDYSTPKSADFINGILDSLSKEMVEQGKIRKSGRGLIDNKS
jgi:transcription antitermination protein NusB